jgi:hypothetical protein
VSIHIGRLWYIICDAPGPHRRCAEHVVPTQLSTPFGVGAIFADRLDACALARDEGWDVEERDCDGPHFCPEHRTDKADGKPVGTTITGRPTWITELSRHWGEPPFVTGEDKPVRQLDGHHRAWVWFPDGFNHEARIIQFGRRFVIELRWRGGKATLADDDGMPSDERCRAVLAAAGWWPAGAKTAVRKAPRRMPADTSLPKPAATPTRAKRQARERYTAVTLPVGEMLR